VAAVENTNVVAGADDQMITERQRELRRKHLQASDMASILGLNPWASEVDVYFSKVYQTEDVTNEAMAVGNWLELPLTEYACERLGVKGDRRNLFRIEDHPSKILGANLDCRVVGKDEAIEAKWVGDDPQGEWGEDGSAQIPRRVFVQVQTQMHVAGLSKVWVVAALGHQRMARRIYEIERDQPVIDQISEYGREWWNKYVVPKVAPSGEATDLARVKAIRRVAAKTVTIPADLVVKYIDASALRGAADKAHAQAQTNLLAALGDAEIGDFGDTDDIVAYRLQNSAPKVDHAKLKIDGVWSRYCSQGQHRTLRIVAKSSVK
jgi:putative phage-type endonuclease